VAGDTAGRAELTEQRPQAVGVLSDLREDFGVVALEVAGGHQGWTTMAGACDVHHVLTGMPDQTVEMGIDEAQAGTGAPMAEQSRLDVLDAQRALQQRVFLQIDLTNDQVVRGTPPGVHTGEFILCKGRYQCHSEDGTHPIPLRGTPPQKCCANSLVRRDQPGQP